MPAIRVVKCKKKNIEKKTEEIKSQTKARRSGGEKCTEEKNDTYTSQHKHTPIETKYIYEE